ncbi:hypothetical protein EI555_010984 [Monodon monoceros]|uniref:Uncharacterized protein n=1 Tax=Monodon monoceros TaxID=40151 RepID=A0A4U1FI10_MONMO|nr:hypothetical protein EI555_010984 [Monodon monoceros]
MNMGKRPMSPPPAPPQVLEKRAVFEVNENSLKRLSAYLENLQKPGFKSLKPTQLVFYVRETDQNSSDGQEHFSTSGIVSWLDNNGKSAVKKLKNSLPLRKELDRLKDELSHQLQLSDIRWQRSWGIAHRCSQLHSLGRLAQQNLESLKNAKGKQFPFTSEIHIP